MTVSLYDEAENAESIIEMWARGDSPTTIAKNTGVQRKQVQAIIRAWSDHIQQDAGSRNVARDMLNKMVEHYEHLIRDFRKVVDEIDDATNGAPSHQWIGQKISALKSIAELDKVRVDLMQKAGMLDNTELGDELAEMEKQKEIILDILRNDLCEKCRPEVMHRIGEMTGKIEVVVVENQ